MCQQITLTVCYYFSTSQYNLYEDDGNSTKYEPGADEYSTQLFTMKAIDQYVTQQYSYICNYKSDGVVLSRAGQYLRILVILRYWNQIIHVSPKNFSETILSLSVLSMRHSFWPED